MFNDITHTLADHVSHLIKTRYVHLAHKEDPFGLAFTDTMNEFGVRSEARGNLKSEIGKILSSRPRKLSKKSMRNAAKCGAQFPLTVTSATREEVLLTFFMGIHMRFRRNNKGLTVNVSYTGNPSPALLAQANAVAEKIFAEKDHEAVQYTRLRILEEDVNHLLVLIDGTYEAYISRGLRTSTVPVTITRNGKSVTQKEVPADLLCEAKAIAKQCFKNSGSLPLQFE